MITCSPDLKEEAIALQNVLSSDFSVTAQLADSGSGDIVLALDESLAEAGKEAYTLKTDADRIVITGSDAAGVFYGIQTLRQIIQTKGSQLEIQKATITDYPRFAWRAFMLDEGRHFKGAEVVKQLLDQMASLKMNVFHWHLTEDQGWRIEIKKYPKLTEVGAFRDSTEIDHFGSERYDGKPHGGFFIHKDK